MASRTSNGDIAFSREEMNKIVRHVLLGGTAMAGIAALIGSQVAKNRKTKGRSIEDNTGAIFVPIKKTTFMKDLKSPEEFKAEYDIKHPRPSETPVVPVGSSNPVNAVMAAEESVEEKKKRLLASAGRFDYFRKAASEDYVEESPERSEGQVGKGETDDNAIKIDHRRSRAGEGVKNPTKDEDDMPRDEKGRFVSQNDKEKQAGVPSPVREAVVYPASITAVALGSLWVANKIVDKVSENRKKKAEEELDDARNEYVSNLEKTSEEKSASNNGKSLGIGDISGRVIGAATIIPAVMMMMITDRVIEKRRQEKAKAKENAGGIPEEPLVFYKTSSGDLVDVSPEDMLGSILMKKASMEFMDEVEKYSASIEKCAADDEGMLEKLWHRTPSYMGGKYLAGKIGDLQGAYGHRAIENVDNPGAMFTAAPMWMKRRYANEHYSGIAPLLDTFKDGMATKDTYDMLKTKEGRDIFFNLMGEMQEKDPAKIKHTAKALAYYGVDPREFGKVLSSGEAQDVMINNFKNPAFADTWGKKRDELIRNSIIDKFGDNWFGKIVAWLAKYTGIGNWMFNNKLRDRMKGFGGDLSSALPGGVLDNMFSIAAKARADEAGQNAEAENGKTTGGVAQEGLPNSQNPQPVANAGAAAGAAPVPAAPAAPAAPATQPVVAAPVDQGRPPVGVNVDKYGNPVPV